MDLEQGDLTGRIIGAAINVHRQLGPGFIESVYENSLVVELRNRGVKVFQQVEVDIEYAGVQVGKHRLDLLVEDIIIVELKTIKAIEDIHYAILRSYLKATAKEHGLILNFAKVTLEIKRVHP